MVLHRWPTREEEKRQLLDVEMGAAQATEESRSEVQNRDNRDGEPVEQPEKK